MVYKIVGPLFFQLLHKHKKSASGGDVECKRQRRCLCYCSYNTLYKNIEAYIDIFSECYNFFKVQRPAERGNFCKVLSQTLMT